LLSAAGLRLTNEAIASLGFWIASFQPLPIAERKDLTIEELAFAKSVLTIIALPYNLRP
jgi:hypothetical protein